jgi:Right handed beta helix region
VVARRRLAMRRGIALALTLGFLLPVGARPVVAVGLGYTVNTTDDAPEVNTAVVLCQTAAGACSLRAAVMQANAIPPGTDMHTIHLPAGIFTLDIEGQDENNAATGDLDIKVNLRIEGAGAGQTIIQASATSAQDGIDRIFEVRTLGIAFELADVTLRRANSGFGRGTGIHVSSNGADVTVDRVVMTDLIGLDSVGGAIASKGPLLIRDSRFTNIQSDGGPVIWKSGSSLTIRRSTFSGNLHYGGAVGVYGGAIALIDRSTINANTSTGPLSALAVTVGIDSNDDAQLTLRNSTIAGNIGQDAAIVIGKSALTKIESSTIAGNTGYGLSPRDHTEIRNTLLANNDAGNCKSKPESHGNNLDSGNTCQLDAPDDIQNGIADLRTLADNGGPSRTRGLGPDSEAIDAGSSCPAMDQRGVTRKDGDGDGQVVCDIGAYEAPKDLALATPKPTVLPTSEPTTLPTMAPTAKVTAPPATASATSGPATATPTAHPASPAASEGPSAGPPGSPVATPAASGPPIAVVGEDGGTTVVIAVLVVTLVALLVGMFLALRRRRPTASSD